jgi:uncharacterized protein (TIGR02453 family)
MTDRFDGFSIQSMQFLHDLRLNNNKGWFEEHKSDYQEHILRPMQALVTELAPMMLSIDQDFEVRPALNRTISRIYRDTRFSRDKSPYKTCNWITFKRPTKEWKEHPGYFFELSPGTYRYGMGFYSAARETMGTFRRRLDANPRQFLAAISSFTGQETFTIEGEEYKRPLKGGLPKELQPWYNRKTFYLACNREVRGNCIDRGLLKELTAGFQALTPLYQYLCRL